MSKGLGAAYAKKWRDNNPEIVERYKRSLQGKYAQLKRAAKRKGLELLIPFNEYESLLQRGECHYCKGPLSDYGYSLDRLDHLKGYISGNVVPCCGVRNGSRQLSCNFRKGHLECTGFVYPRTVELLLELLSKGEK